MKTPRWLLVGAAAYAGSLAYFRLFRPWQLSWGATADEVGRPLPGDQVVLDPTFDATRAITIAARPDQIWPWLLQVGVKRAGWYSYDVLDNLGRPSAREIIPELQHVAVGDVVPLSPDGKHGIRVLALDLPRSMMWGTLPDTTWLWVTVPQADGTTRLITRIRSQYRWLSPSIAFSLLVEFADIWMIRKMLLGVRERAEELARGGSTGSPSLAVTPQGSRTAPTARVHEATNHRAAAIEPRQTATAPAGAARCVTVLATAPAGR